MGQTTNHHGPALTRRTMVMPLGWTGHFVPQIGQLVRVTSRHGQLGRVQGFFAADRQLGVYVTLAAEPAVWSRAASDQRDVLTFGHDIEPDDIEPDDAA